MAFNYSINTGKLAYQKLGVNNPGNTVDYNSEYLKNTFGFSDDALSGIYDSSVLNNPGEFAKEYQAIFGKSLAVSDAYTFFDAETCEHPMNRILTSSEIDYTADNPLDSRIAVYKEMFLEKFSGTAAGASTSLTITNNAYDTNYQTDFGNAASLIATKNSTNTAKLNTLYTQLETEAAAIKSELNQNELAYGGYPEIGYSSTDAKVKLLKQQLDVATQNYLTVYDELFGYYKIKAGADKYDNDSGDSTRREQEAATAATMTAKMAMDYAEKYYSQSIKPTTKDYVFGQAPVIFSFATATPGERETYGTLLQRGVMTRTLDDYASTDATAQGQLNTLLANTTNNYYQINNKNYQGKDGSNYSGVFFDLKTDATLTGGEDSDKDSSAVQKNLSEIGSKVSDYIRWMVRDTYGVGGLTSTIRNTDYCAEDQTYLAKDMMAAAQKLVDLKMQLEKVSVEGAINNQLRAEYEARIGAMNAIDTMRCPNGTDPYTVDINGQKYMLGQDQNKDGTINSMLEILGNNDSTDNTFASLKNLDTNNDGYVSQEELQAQNIILSAVNANGQLNGKGYDMSLVKGINLADIQKLDGSNNSFGKFTMDLQNQKVNGDLTFEDTSYFNKLFGWDNSKIDNIDEDKSVAPIAIPVSTKAATSTVPATQEAATTETKAEETAAPAAVETPVAQTAVANTDKFSFSFTDATDNKSSIEKLLDQLCWKLGITNISSSQKYSIIDGIDPTTDASIAESQIQEDLEKFNLSA